MSILKDHIHHYLGCLAILKDGAAPVRVSGISTTGFISVSDPNAIDAGMYVDISEITLMLRPLDSMTEEECLELCKIASPQTFGHFRKKKWVPKRDPKSDEFWSAYDVKREGDTDTFVVDLIDGQVSVYQDGDFEPTVIEHHYWQWYYKKGFDIPVYPENRTLIQLGLAIKL